MSEPTRIVGVSPTDQLATQISKSAQFFLRPTNRIRLVYVSLEALHKGLTQRFFPHGRGGRKRLLSGSTQVNETPSASRANLRQMT